MSRPKPKRKSRERRIPGLTKSDQRQHETALKRAAKSRKKKRDRS